jgi:hypothetical protein
MTSRFPARTTSDPSVSSWGKPASAGIGVKDGYGTASGGTATTVGPVAYEYVEFTGNGSFTPTSAGLFDVLIFGGGSGGNADSAYSGGGGSGGISQQTIYLNTGSQTVTIGGGGATDASGNPSSIGAIPSAIAAAGGVYGSNVGRYINIGAFSGQTSTNSVGVNNIQGYAGGTSAFQAGGGGGSTTAVGGNASSQVGGAGAAGFDVSAFIGGSALYKGAGGGGGGETTGGAGGSSIGGRGSSSSLAATTPAANTASGGGSRQNANGATAGGSGIIYIRWKV